MKKTFIVLTTILISILFTSCLTTNFIEKGTVNYSEDLDKSKVMDGILLVLMENNINVKNANKDFGLIETEWIKTSDIADNVGMSILLGSLSSSMSFYEYYVKLNFRVTDNLYYVIPSKKEIEDGSSIFSSQKENFWPVREDSEEAEIVKKILADINNVLNIKGETVWDIKTE